MIINGYLQQTTISIKPKIDVDYNINSSNYNLYDFISSIFICKYCKTVVLHDKE